MDFTFETQCFRKNIVKENFRQTAELSLHISASKTDIKKRIRRLLDNFLKLFRTLKLFVISIQYRRIFTLVKVVVKHLFRRYFKKQAKQTSFLAYLAFCVKVWMISNKYSVRYVSEMTPRRLVFNSSVHDVTQMSILQRDKSCLRTKTAFEYE